MYWGLAGSVGTQGPEGYRWHKGAPRGIGGIRGPLGASGVYWGWHGAPRDVRGIGVASGLGT